MTQQDEKILSYSLQMIGFQYLLEGGTVEKDDEGNPTITIPKEYLIWEPWERIGLDFTLGGGVATITLKRIIPEESTPVVLRTNQINQHDTTRLSIGH